MIFNIHYDGGDRISGTVIPDAYSQICKIRVTVGGREIAVFPTNEFNQGVRDLGLHETGMVNFTITEQLLPGLSTFEDLELHEVESKILLYRRFRPGMVAQKFLRIETQLLPLWRFDEAVKPSFQQYYKRIETLGLSGTRQIFHLSQDSIYASGRILIKNFMHSIDNGFNFIVLIRNPYEELAERLLILNRINDEGLNALGEREAMTLRETAKYAATLPVDDEKELIRALRRMPKDVAMILENPVVRQFSTSSLDEQARDSGVATALDVLAQSTIVGLRSETWQFAAAFGELIGQDLSDPSLFPSFPKVSALADTIRTSRSCDLILEKDLELYYQVVESHKSTIQANKE